MVPACATREAPPVQKAIELGAHRVHVAVPAGWDALDQGAQTRFRRGESDIVLQNLGPVSVDAALASLQDERRRDVKSRRLFLIENREAVEIETWNRLDHTWPQRLLFVRAGDDLLALHTPRLADPETTTAFAALRESLHFVVSERR
jgi:hypothetical protein